MIESNVDLTAFNTFGVPSKAEQYVRLDSLEQLKKLALAQPPAMILAGGSNVLLLDKLPGLTVHVALRGIQVISTEPATTSAATVNVPTVTVRVAAGVNWHQLVLYSLQQHWFGLENLALIPGTVGAAPVQNIGAYGVEVASRIVAVHAYEYGKGPVVLSPEDCQFGYRDSFFKQHPGRYLITAVDFRLGGSYTPAINYGAIREKLQELQFDEPYQPGCVARAVIEIRAAKLPFYSALGNSGSFFKNPVIPQSEFDRLQVNHPNLPHYPAATGQVKIPAGWLIDQAGWRGKRIGAVGCYHRQALVIVNHGGATGKEVLAFSKQVQASVQDTFGIALEREVQLIGQ